MANTENYKILKRFLDKHFPDVTTALVYKTPLQLLVATMMAAQCTDTLVNKVTPVLFKKYKSAKDFADADLAQLRKDIYPVTFYNNKAVSIIKMGKMLVEKHGGKVPQTMAGLVELPGVARKTANVVLGHAFGIQVGVVVDTHVRRISNRYGLTKSQDPVKIEQDLIKIIPKDKWTLTADQIIWFGRKICTARFDKCHLYAAELKDICPEARKNAKAAATKSKKVKK